MKSKKNNRKGQAALEFLMTYGWAFLVMLVVIGAFMYFDVLNPAGLIPPRCSFPAGFGCTEHSALTNGVTFTFVNRNGETIQIEEAKIIDTGGDMAEIDCTIKKIESGESISNWTDIKFRESANLGDRIVDGTFLYAYCHNDEFVRGEGERFQGDIILNYYRAGSYTPQQAKGSLGASVVPFELNDNDGTITQITN